MKEKFIPYGKLSKKERKAIDSRKRNNGFGVDMRTKVIPDKTKYNRKQRRQEKW